MSDFADIASKLNAPSKKSLFERQKAEAEAKKAREKAETAAVLQDFVKSFDDDDNDNSRNGPPSHSSLNLQRGGTYGSNHGGAGKRHYTTSNLKSGPGSLGPISTLKSGPGSLGPTFYRKRPYDEYADRRDKGGSGDGGRLGYSERRRASEDEEGASVAAKPTLQLSSLPYNTTPAVVKALLASSPLNVENVRIVTPSTSTSPNADRKSVSAIVTLSAETPASDIDTVVSHLQNRYLGFGFKLSISRHLSSTATQHTALSSGGPNQLPFGAKFMRQQQSLSRAPPPGQRFAPPLSYTSSAPYSRGPHAQVHVRLPHDLKQLRLIHKTIEALLTHGPEFEALLMSRPEVQSDEKWAWLWDSRSTAGVYYRWRLWEILTDAKTRMTRRGQQPETLFDGQAPWLPPPEPLRFEYATKVEEFVSDDDYNSSDEEDEEGSLARRYNDHHHRAAGPTLEEGNDGLGYLDPLATTKLVHLLSRLPENSAKLTKGDVARITGFAIEHAGAGADEVAMLATRNAVKPFRPAEEEDTSSASLVGLYVISDILSASASAGVRHAWRYRTLFEHALRKQKVFEKLGRIEKDLRWGKLKAEKWKRSIQALFNLWEGWSVFPQATHEGFVNCFTDPPLTEEEIKAAETERLARAEEEEKEEELKRGKSLNKWRSVDDEDRARERTGAENVDGVPFIDDDDDDPDDEVLIDDNLDGVSLTDSSDEEDLKVQTMSVPQDVVEQASQSVPTTKAPATEANAPTAEPASTSVSQPPPSSRKQRPRAADLFADDSG